jgi:hypothetical protein
LGIEIMLQNIVAVNVAHRRFIQSPVKTITVAEDVRLVCNPVCGAA